MKTLKPPKFLCLGMGVEELPLSEAGQKCRIWSGSKEIGTRAEKISHVFVPLFWWSAGSISVFKCGSCSVPFLLLLSHDWKGKKPTLGISLLFNLNCSKIHPNKLQPLIPQSPLQSTVPPLFLTLSLPHVSQADVSKFYFLGKF